MSIRAIQIGMTLVELMTVVIIAVILALIAIPSYISHLHKSESKKVRILIVSSYRLAKTQSYINHNDVIVCPAGPDNNCNRDGQEMLLVYYDKNQNRRYDTAHDVLIAKHYLKLSYGKIYLRASRSANYIKFFGDTGLPRGHMGHIKYCPNDGNTSNMYQVSINMSGGHRFKPNSHTPTDCP